MRLNDISIPEVYKESADFRFFLKWFELCLSQIHYDTENIYDLYDPKRCKSELLWMLADTMGFKYDDSQYPAFNRLVLVYFMSMIRSRGSKDGMLTAAQVNLASKTILKKFVVENESSDPDMPDWVERWEDLEDTIYEDRLYSDVLPTNSVSVVSNPASGYIDVVYFADSLPQDSCIEYVRPVGMYCSQTPGVKYDVRTRISIDARLVDDIDGYSPTRVADYSDKDYASLQGYTDGNPTPRDLSFYRNSKFERTPTVDAGYRTLYSLQVSNPSGISRASLQNINQADNLSGIDWVDTGVTYNQLSSELGWVLPEPEIVSPEMSTDDVPKSDNTISQPSSMGTLGSKLI